jgi:hypothetical protein
MGVLLHLELVGGHSTRRAREVRVTARVRADDLIYVFRTYVIRPSFGPEKRAQKNETNKIMLVMMIHFVILVIIITARDQQSDDNPHRA